MSKILTLTPIVTILVIFLLSSATPFVAGENGGNSIFIRADGSVDPSTAPIKRNGNTYILTGDVYNKSIIVERDGVTIDGNGHAIQGFNIPLSKGMDLTARKHIIIEGLKIANFYFGILLNDSQSNIIRENTISSCTYIIGATGSENNRIYHNNFLSSPNRVYGGVNLWDNGYPDGGNFWSNSYNEDYYSGLLQNVEGSDGIGDSIYEIDEDNFDNYPLMGSLSVFKLEKQEIVYPFHIISNSRISSVAYSFSSNDQKISFYADNGASSDGFCLICVPHILLDEPYEILVDGQYPSYINYNIYDNRTRRWIYFTYENPKDVQIIPEFPPTLTVALPFLLAITLTIMIYKKKISSLKEKHLPLVEKRKCF